MRAVVVGGGVGGLAAALALRRAGWSVTILERVPGPRPAGAALLLWPNAIRALRALGVADPLLARAYRNRVAVGRRANGRVLTRIDLGRLADRGGEPAVTVLRSDLLDVLDDARDGIELVPGTTVTGLAEDGTAAVRAGADTWAADLIVAADGVGSVLRRALAPDCRVERTGYIAWRALVPPARAPELELPGETLGVGRRFGCADLGRSGAYWYATLPGTVPDIPPEQQLAGLRRDLAGWHRPIPELLAATDPDELFCHEITQLWPLPRRLGRPLGAGGVALLGDAAHAMTPDLGQGACLALEDAVTLGAALPAGTPVPVGLDRYHRLRARRVRALSRLSRRTGLALELRSPVTVWLRDAVMAAVPGPLLSSATLAPTRWRPPTPER
jgi:2-polyprenyl-6-methoxyphenol hydroxylase-like FAD-dependent oxidoreductase